ELPANIRAELDHFHKLNQARKLKAAVEKDKPSAKKRVAKTTAKGPPAKKKIEAFFKKDS
ncbi:hypothetical protein ANCCAN_26291, partial [Ancylostoma caninum]